MIRSKNTAKGVLLKNDSVLLIKKSYADGRVVYTLPGGTQELGEPLEQTVIREVWEEVGAEVEVDSLAKVYEHQRPSKSTPGDIKHKIEFAFLCRLIEPYTPHNGVHPDPSQTGVEWIPLSDLTNKALDPTPLASLLRDVIDCSGSQYQNLISS